MQGRNMSAFNLGFDGEEWNSELNTLLVPVPDTNKIVMVARNREDGFSVITQEKWEAIGDLLMVASYVQHFIDTYVTTGGNNGVQTNPET